MAVIIVTTGFAMGWAGSAVMRARHATVPPTPAPAAVATAPSAPTAPPLMAAAATIAVPVAAAAAASAAAVASETQRKPRERRRLPGTTKPGESRYRVAAGGTSPLPAVTEADGFELKGLDPARASEASEAVESSEEASPETMVVVKRSEHRLYLYKDGELIKSYKVGVGKRKGSTPVGKFRIIGKAHNPAWNYKGKYVPGGSPANPLGKWWMALSVTHKSGTRFGIHGTNAPWSIGGNVSRGCIRMLNKDAANLYRQVNAGTPVLIY